MLDLTLIPTSNAVLPEVRINRHWIGGAVVPPRDGDGWTERQSPSHGVVVSRSARGTAADAEAAIAAARAAFDDGRWSQLSGKARATVLLLSLIHI